MFFAQVSKNRFFEIFLKYFANFRKFSDIPGSPPNEADPFKCPSLNRNPAGATDRVLYSCLLSWIWASRVQRNDHISSWYRDVSLYSLSEHSTFRIADQWNLCACVWLMKYLTEEIFTLPNQKAIGVFSDSLEPENNEDFLQCPQCSN